MPLLGRKQCFAPDGGPCANIVADGGVRRVLSVYGHPNNLGLYLGRVMELADRDQIYANPRHPYTQALISAVPLPDPELERHKTRIVLRGDLPSPLNPPSGCLFRTRCPKAADVCAREEPALGTTAQRSVACHFADEGV